MALKRTFKLSLAFPLSLFVPLKGLTAAQEYLKDKEDKWLKTTYRGDFETYHYVNAFLSSQWFNRRRAEIGAGSENIDIIIEDNIPSKCETGMDAPMLNGDTAQYPTIGYEAKDEGYVCRVVDKLPTVIQGVMDKLKPAFKSGGYQGWHLNEIEENSRGRNGLLRGRNEQIWKAAIERVTVNSIQTSRKLWRIWLLVSCRNLYRQPYLWLISFSVLPPLRMTGCRFNFPKR